MRCKYACDDPLGDVSAEELAALLEEQTQVSTRLSQIVPCGGSDVAASESTFRSGSYFDVARSGEGKFVEVLTNGQILVIWYTFDPQGNQMWIIAQGSFDGTTATIDALYPTSFTPFGSQFDPDEVVLSPWGTFTLSFDSCNSLEFSYDSTAPGYGSGSFNYSRLTQLAGTQCP